MIGLNLATSAVPRTLAQILTVPDGAVTWKWGVMMPDTIPEPIEGFGEEEESGFLNKLWGYAKSAAKVVTKTINAVENQISTAGLCLRAESIKIPFESINSTTSRTQARLRNFPDQINVESIDITFYEDYNYTALTYLDKWKRSIVNEYGVFRLPGGDDGYAKDIYAFLFDTTGILKGIVQFENCYPEQITPINFGSTSDVVKISCSFNVQYIKWLPADIINFGSIGSVGKNAYQQVRSGDYTNVLKRSLKNIKSTFKKG